ncbi:FxLD family lanthipeptide [Nocardioides sp. NPDC057772]|uniref:FxLD family lanthipeptide n=1 Tax=Nocardioides sp. NPDC057772 TaxID=3346245 RepID=UPI00366C3ED4
MTMTHDELDVLGNARIEDYFDLDITTIESAPVVGDMLNATSDGCTSTCQSACSNSTCIQ